MPGESESLAERLADYEQDKGDLRLALEAATVQNLRQLMEDQRQLNQQIDKEVLAGRSEESKAEGVVMGGDIKIRSPEQHYHYSESPGKSKILPWLLTGILGALGGSGLALAVNSFLDSPANSPPAVDQKIKEGFLIELIPNPKKE